MDELHKKPETTDIKSPEIDNFKAIKPESDMTVNEARSFTDGLLDDLREQNDGYHTTYEDRLKYTPTEERASWKDKRGESVCIPNSENPDGKVAKDKLAEYKLAGIDYKNAEPDFSDCCGSEVKIDNMSENRDNYYDKNGSGQPGNFSQADIKCAEKWNAENKDGKNDWTPRGVVDRRKDNTCSWHECCDTKTMQLVPREIHSFFTHSGGVAECKARDNNIGGGYDD